MLTNLLAVFLVVFLVVATIIGVLILNRLIVVLDTYLTTKNRIKRYEVNVTTPNDGEALKSLDDLINNTIAEYYALNIGYRSTKGINSKMEEEMQKNIAELVGTRISDTLIDKLTFYYDRDSLDQIIANKCFIKVTDFIIAQNRPE